MKFFKNVLSLIFLLVFSYYSFSNPPVFYFKKEYLLCLIQKFSLTDYESKTNFSDRLLGNKYKKGVSLGVALCNYDYEKKLKNKQDIEKVEENLKMLEKEMLSNFAEF